MTVTTEYARQHWMECAAAMKAEDAEAAKFALQHCLVKEATDDPIVIVVKLSGGRWLAESSQYGLNAETRLRSGISRYFFGEEGHCKLRGVEDAKNDRRRKDTPLKDRLTLAARVILARR